MAIIGGSWAVATGQQPDLSMPLQGWEEGDDGGPGGGCKLHRIVR